VAFATWYRSLTMSDQVILIGSALISGDGFHDLVSAPLHLSTNLLRLMRSLESYFFSAGVICLDDKSATRRVFR